MDDTFELIAAERRRAADMFDSLSDEQLATPSLCSEWTVREILGHLVLPFSVSTGQLMLGVMRAGGSFSRFSVRASKQIAKRPPHELTTLLRARARSRFTPPGLGPEAPLTDMCVHTRDAARPLGLDVTAPTEAWRVVLDFVTSPQARRGFVPARRLDGLRLSATDLDWAHGDGSEVTGPSEAVALAVLGRTVALDDLAGAGVDVLRGRLRHPVG